MKNETLKILAIIGAIIVMLFLIGFVSVMKENPNEKKYGIIEIEMGIATFTDNSLEYEIDDENVIKFDHKETKSNTKKNEVGGTKNEQYYFVGVNEGSTNVKFIKRDGNNEISGKYEYKLIVDKNLKVEVETIENSNSSNVANNKVVDKNLGLNIKMKKEVPNDEVENMINEIKNMQYVKNVDRMNYRTYDGNNIIIIINIYVTFEDGTDTDKMNNIKYLIENNETYKEIIDSVSVERLY